MSYTWQNGEVITAEKLNNIEQGIEEAKNFFDIVHITIKYGQSTTYTCEESFEDLLALKENTNSNPIIVAMQHGDASNASIEYYYGYIQTGYANVSGIVITTYKIIAPASESQSLKIQTYRFNITNENVITCYETTKNIS